VGETCTLCGSFVDDHFLTRDDASGVVVASSYNAEGAPRLCMPEALAVELSFRADKIEFKARHGDRNATDAAVLAAFARCRGRVRSHARHRQHGAIGRSDRQ